MKILENGNREVYDNIVNYQQFGTEFGGLKENTKLYKGVDKLPVIEWTYLSITENMNILNLPELHLMLGVGQELYDAISLSMSETEMEIHQQLLKSIT